VLELPDELPVAAGPFFDSSKARVVLSDIEPSVHLGIEDSEFKPIVKVVPDYPLAAARRGVEGHVVVEYTVTRTGTVEDPVVVDSSNPVFNRAALDATRHFKYRPRLIRGEAVDVRGVRLVMRFELEA
jgi:protein TonB